MGPGKGTRKHMDSKRRSPRCLALALGIAVMATLVLGSVPAGATPLYSFAFQFGGEGSGEGQFESAWGVATDSEGDVYVVDNKGDRVQKFDAEGGYLSEFGEEGTGNGQLKEPKGIATDSEGNVYVADNGNKRVQKFDSEGEYVTQWSHSEKFGEFEFPLSPVDVATDSKADVYVVANSNHVLKFDSEGKYLGQIGEGGTGEGQFFVPMSVATDSEDDVYVADATGRVQKFNSAGEYLSQFGEYGSGEGQIGSPFGLTVDSEGNVWIADHGNDRVLGFDSEGEYEAELGWQTTISEPNGVVVGPGGLWVTSGSSVQNWIVPTLQGPVFVPKSNEFPVDFTATGGAALLQAASTYYKFECAGSTTGTGKFLNEHESDVTLTFNSCGWSFGSLYKCTSPGQSSGTIRTSSLKARPVYPEEGLTAVGFLLEPTKSPTFMKFTCGPISAEVTGSAIVDLAAPSLEEPANVFTSSIVESGPQQTKGSEELHFLAVSINGAALEEMSLETEYEATLANEEEATLFAEE